MRAAAALKRDNRHALRLDVRLQAGLREPGSAQRFEVDVIDLSVTGFRCETSFTLAIGQPVYLTIPSFGPLEAVVVRRNRFTYGCQFERPLHAAVFDHIAARYRRL